MTHEPAPKKQQSAKRPSRSTAVSQRLTRMRQRQAALDAQRRDAERREAEALRSYAVLAEREHDLRHQLAEIDTEIAAIVQTLRTGGRRSHEIAALLEIDSKRLDQLFKRAAKPTTPAGTPSTHSSRAASGGGSTDTHSGAA
ncbi:hypothetical protein GCM10012275_54070 [Longimycelium tulufanense]|uniref:Uncharacterized protein n=1 Tax=Longimycelium tulufanense TaxID=907463 RepID=A0A8J3CJ78_9PSEU|nr:hypothetical protein [Longimycelium tulufanense]GGM76441.1 hypothetical protein GCM10012275_54070 [Longimycelium tulufanense]